MGFKNGPANEPARAMRRHRHATGARGFPAAIVLAVVSLSTVSPTPILGHGTTPANVPTRHPAASVGPSATIPGTRASALWHNLTLSGPAPSVRNRAVLVNDPTAGYSVLFGGYDAGGSGWLGDTWTISGNVWSHRSTPTSPGARSSASAAYDPDLAGVVVFGGFHYPSPYYNDTWLYKANNWSNVSGAVAPPVRSEASMAYDPALQELVLFGGTNGGAYLNDTWAYGGGVWRQLALPIAPPPLSGGSMAYDTTLSALILYGGTMGSTLASGTWTFNGAWSQLPNAVAPGGRYLSTMTTFPNGTVLLCGGQNLTSTNTSVDAWEFSGSDWVQISAGTGPNSRGASALTYDSSDGYPLLFGGRFCAYGTCRQSLNDSWAFDTLAGRLLPFSNSGVAPFTVTPAVSLLGGTRNPNGTSTVSYLWRFGDGGTSTSGAPGHTYALAGEESINLVVADAFGLTLSFLASVSVQFGLKITIQPVPGSPLTYNFSVSIQNATAPVSLLWHFGDGNTSTSVAPNHTYGAAGPVTIEVDGRDANGAIGSASQTFNATLNATSPTGPSSGGSGSTGFQLPILAWIVIAIVAAAAVVGVVLALRARRPPGPSRSPGPDSSPP
jgi:PKD repeat protein